MSAGISGDVVVRPAAWKSNGKHPPPDDLAPDPPDPPDWSPRIIALWDVLMPTQRELFRGPAWRVGVPHDPVRKLVEFLRECRRHYGVTIDDLLSVQFEDGFAGGNYGQFHARWAREMWDDADKREREEQEADKPVLRLRFGWEATRGEPLGTVVTGLLHSGSITLVYGPPKSGKSFLVTDLFLSISAAMRANEPQQWMDHTVVRPGPALVIACEGHAGYWKRLAAAAKARDWDEESFPKGFFLATGRPTLIQIDEGGLHYAPDASSILRALDDAKKRGMRPVAIAIDTVFRSFGHGNVNASPDMNVYLACIAELTDLGYAVVLVHHEIKSGGTPAGSVSLIGGSDNIIRTWRETETSEKRFWQLEMAKDDPETAPRAFTLEVIPLGVDLDGQPASSCVVHDGGASPDTPAKNKRGRPPSENSSAAILAELIHRELCNLLADPREGQEVRIDPQAPTFRAVSRTRLRGAINRAGILTPLPEGDERKRVMERNNENVKAAINRLKKDHKVAANEQWIGLPK